MNAPTRGIPLRPDRAALAAEQRRSLHRALTAAVLKSGSASRIGPEDFARSAWPDDAQAARIAKAVSSPASTTTAGALQLSAVGMFRSLAAEQRRPAAVREGPGRRSARPVERLAQRMRSIG
jgi:hypothetical protein